jgi:hypothetical protein
MGTYALLSGGLLTLSLRIFLLPQLGLARIASVKLV